MDGNVRFQKAVFSLHWENYKHAECATRLNFYEYFLLKKKETIMSSTLISLYSKIAKYEQNQFGLDVDRDALVKKLINSWGKLH